MSRAVGVLLVVLLALVYAGAIRETFRRPFRTLGVLVAGMAFHNFLLMILLRLGTPHALVRVAQAWKEGLLVLLALLALAAAYRGWRAHQLPRLLAIDWLVVAFTAVLLIYFLLPGSVLHSHVSLSQRVLGLRVLALIPLLYLFGRVFGPRDRSDLAWVAGLLLGSAAIVGLFGLVELWFIPTARWIDWGVNDLSAWLGFSYHGPGGLPENFFQATAEGYLLRRMVSTYVSPLGIAYTGLLIVPLGIALLYRKRALPRLPWWLPAIMLSFTMVGVLFSLTRLALAAMVGEVVVLYILLRRRSLVLICGLLALAVAFMFYLYPRMGPLVDWQLQSVAHRGSVHMATTNDPSTREHIQQIIADLKVVRHHPLGFGLGSSIHRFGVASGGTGESAVFDVFGDIGLLGGLLYLALYLGGILYGVRAFLRTRGDPLSAALPLAVAVGGLALIPITLTSDVWSDFSVTFLYWWALGYSVSIATRAQPAVRVDVSRARDRFSEPDTLVI